MKKIIASISLLTVAALSASILVHTQSIPASDDTTVITDPLKYLSEKKIFEGYEDGELHPEKKLTRAQFAKILQNSFPDTNHIDLYYNFDDVDTSHWAHNYIQFAAACGWLEGFPDGSFKPEENITYEQALTVICRILNLPEYSKVNYPADYISCAIDYSLNDNINAIIGEEINRQQAAQLIVNAFNYENGQIDYSYNNNMQSYSLPTLSGGSSPAPIKSKNETVENYTSKTAPDTDEVVLTDCVIDFPDIDYKNSYNTEEYVASSENVFKSAVTSPLSTFSIDTDTASYSNLRRFILNGQEIPNGAIRTEELLNYFNYSKAETETGKPFGVKYTISDCPWNKEHDLAMITVSGEELVKPKPSNLVFLIDISGSMYDYNKLPLVKQSLALLLDKLGEQDKISIVTYASGTSVALEPTPATKKTKILKVIDSLQAGGSTAGESGINLAYEQAEKYKIDGNNRIILCTDGDFNIGMSSTGDLEQLITQKRENGIYLSVLGFGMMNYKDNKMETLADKGNGNYAYIDNLKEAKKVLVDDMSKTIYTIAKDVKIQTEFNPEKVSEYRLIGYENRTLNAEDFDNDKKDAGELGAGATVTVLYEIIPQSNKSESSLKYQTTQTTGSDELMTVKIRYKLPDESESVLTEYPVNYELSDATSDFNFAVAVAELGMILNNSEYKGNSTYDTVIELARQGVENDEFGLRHEFIQLVDLLRFTRNSNK